MPRGVYLGELEQIVMLAVARLDGDAYGMRIRREIESRAGRAVAIGAVYATLERLEDKGYVRPLSRGRTTETDARARRFFELTRAGIDALREADAVHARMWEGLPLRRSSRS